MTDTTYAKTDGTRADVRRRALAQRKQQVTREAILEAAVSALRDVGIDCSMQDVADRAGVTHRTVYRYFASREALLDAVSRWHDERLEAEGAREPSSIDELPEAIERLFVAFDRDPDLVRAAALMALTRNEQTPSRAERTERQRQLGEAAFPHLTLEERAGAFAVMRTLAGSLGWYVLATQFGLGGAQSGPAVRRALEVMIADLRRRDREAAGGRPTAATDAAKGGPR